jgi:hypothetical protein
MLAAPIKRRQKSRKPAFFWQTAGLTKPKIVIEKPFQSRTLIP